MTNGMTVKTDMGKVTYDIHLNGTCCSGFSDYKKGPKEAIFHLLTHFTSNRGEYWQESLYKEYYKGHKVIAAMPLVGWVDD